jgi:hypothetical protein
MEMFNSDIFVGAAGDCGAVVLADQVILDGRECDAVRRFVENGGALVVTGETGTRDIDNKPLRDFSLADVLGVKFEGAADSVNCYLRVTGLDDRFGIPAMDVQIPAGYVRVKTTTARTLLELVPPYEGIAQGTPPPALETEGPGVTFNSYGKGKAIYCAPKLFTAYFTADTPVLRKLALWMLDRVYPVQERTIELANAPVNVEMFYNRRGDDRFVHLVNYAGDKREKGVPHAQDFPLVYGIQISMRLPRKPQAVALVPEGRKIPFTYSDGTVVFDAEPLRIHSVYMITA